MVKFSKNRFFGNTFKKSFEPPEIRCIFVYS